MTYRLQFTIATKEFLLQKDGMTKKQKKKVIDYLKDMGRFITDINQKKRNLLRLFSGEKEPYYIPLKVKCLKQRLRFHKTISKPFPKVLPKTLMNKGKPSKSLENFRDPQVSMMLEFTPFSEKDEKRAFHEYVKSFNEEEDCLMKLKKNDESLHMMYMSKLTRFVYNIYHTLQGDWELFCKANKLKDMKLEMFNITYLKV